MEFLRANQLISGVMALLITCVVGLSTTRTEFALGRDADGQRYEALALSFRGEPHSPAAALSAPWCYRVLVPGVAALLPISPESSLPLLSYGSTAAALWVFALLMQRWGMSWRQSLLGMLLYATVFWSVKFSFYSPFYIDSSVQLLFLSTLYAWERRALTVVSGLLIFGVLAKESLVLLVPVFAYAAVRSGRWAERQRWFVGTSVMVGAALAAPRVLISALNDYSPEAALVQTAVRQLSSAHFWSRLPLELASGTGLLLLLALWSRAAWGRLQEQPILMGLLVVGVAQLFGGWDKGRLFLPLLPVIVFLAMPQAKIWYQTSRARCWWGGTLLLQAYLGHLFSPITTHAEYLRWLVPLHASESPTLQCWRVMAVIALWGVWTAVCLPARVVEGR